MRTYLVGFKNTSCRKNMLWLGRTYHMFMGHVFRGHKILFGPKKGFVHKKLLVKKHFGPKKIYCPKKLLVKKNVQSENNFGQKNKFLVQNKLMVKHFFAPKKYLVKRFFGLVGGSIFQPQIPLQNSGLRGSGGYYLDFSVKLTT